MQMMRCYNQDGASSNRLFVIEQSGEEVTEMAKKVSFAAKPIERTAAMEQWVESRDTMIAEAAAEPMKRLTIDLPASLHKRVKAGCAMRGVKMADEIRRLLETHFPE